MKMKNALALGMILVTASINASARQGADDGLPQHRNDRTIQCTDLTTGAVVLSFNSIQGQGSVATANYNLSVKARFDDVGEMNIQDKRSGEILSSVRSEEVLRVSLTSAANAAPVTQTSFTRRGLANAQIADASSQDSATVVSYNRRAESRMETRLMTQENPAAPIAILCQKVR